MRYCWTFPPRKVSATAGSNAGVPDFRGLIFFLDGGAARIDAGAVVEIGDRIVVLLRKSGESSQLLELII